jgi:hypothetical protein
MSDDVDRLLFVPRFSIRAILVATTLFALLFVVIGVGYRGQVWAWGVVIGVASLAVTALVHAACFGLVWCFAQLSEKAAPAARQSGLPQAREDAS